MLRIVLVAVFQQPLTLNDSRTHDTPLMRVVNGARSGHCSRRNISLVKEFEHGLLKPQPVFYTEPVNQVFLYSHRNAVEWGKLLF